MSETSTPAPPEPIPNFTGFIQHLVTDESYGLNSCPAFCPDRDGGEHAHLRTPYGDDMIAWADGHWSGYDLTQSARLIYPAPKRAAGMPRALLPGDCYRTPGGLAVHVKPGCRCP